MVWYNNPESNRVESAVTIPEQFNGYPGIVNGGIVAAILDETSGRAVMLDGAIARTKANRRSTVKPQYL